ncbi:uncharacterized protein LOC132797924 [Drosophila nasuta]|uniref:uncharacterized protein LOC132797924 n=1 Tax=Drosophila nasuta TaxID=42062 RepID=UPI00295E6AEC|nr:uncharacterized protein LOC132797924 [Drosophila nasuta]
MAFSRRSSCTLSDGVSLRGLFSPARSLSPPIAGSPPRQVAPMESEPSPAPVALVTPRGVSVPRRAAPQRGEYVPPGTNSFRCRVCRGVHALRKCPRFAQLTPEKRLRAVLVNKYCPNCLAHQHSGALAAAVDGAGIVVRTTTPCCTCETLNPGSGWRDDRGADATTRRPPERTIVIPDGPPTSPHTRPVPSPALTALLQCKESVFSPPRRSG